MLPKPALSTVKKPAVSNPGISASPPPYVLNKYLMMSSLSYMLLPAGTEVTGAKEQERAGFIIKGTSSTNQETHDRVVCSCRTISTALCPVPGSRNQHGSNPSPLLGLEVDRQDMRFLWTSEQLLGSVSALHSITTDHTEALIEGQTNMPWPRMRWLAKTRFKLMGPHNATIWKFPLQPCATIKEKM
eukprot:1143363-Pelagomonas_calceolata.AAC.3